MKSHITADHIRDFQNDGAVLIKGLFADWVPKMAEAIAANMANPGPYAAENLQEGEAGRFFDDYCNWQSIDVLAEIMAESPAPEAAAAISPSTHIISK